MFQQGTRIRNSSYFTEPPTGSLTRREDADAGGADYVVVTTAVFSGGILSTFGGDQTLGNSWPLKTLMQIEGTNQNNGIFFVQASTVDTGAGQTHITLEPPPKNEDCTGIHVTIRRP